MSLRAIAKRALWKTTRYGRINRCFRTLALKRRLLVMCYHGVIAEGHPGDAHRSRTTVSVSEFREQLRVLARFFTPVSAQDVVNQVCGSHEPPESPILITFDDGYLNNLVHGFMTARRR